MKHQIRTFRAATMDEALDLVREELGSDAVVVESKTTEKRRILPWGAASQEVEVSAQQRRHKSVSSPVEQPDPGMRSGQQKLRTLAEMKSLKKNRSTLLEPVPELPAENLDDHPAMNQLAQPPAWVTPVSTSLQVKREKPVRQTVTIDVSKVADEQSSSTKAEQHQLASLQTIVSRLERHARPKAFNDIPHELYQQYLNLVAVDVEEQIAHELILKLRSHASPQSPKAASSLLTALIEREMRCAPPIMPQTGRREIVMAVGPTGVGKTTTLAKIAGHFQLTEGLRVALITVDTYRVGAIAQLQGYAAILQAPLRSAASPAELRTAIDELDDVDLILIDTAGRSPCDPSKLDELRDLVQISAANHVLLVLSMASSSAILAKVADRFASVSPTSLVLTKLDEIAAHGGLLSMARDVPHPVSYFTTGQDVPDQIEVAHPTRLARLVLGHDRLLPNTD